MCKLWQITHKLNIKPFEICSVGWVIRRSLHIDKIHKNKIHSYNNTKLLVFMWQCYVFFWNTFKFNSHEIIF